MRVIKELCGACPQDIVVELDNGERYDFYLRWGNARLYDESGTEVLLTRQVGGEWDGFMPLDDVERVVTEMAAEWKTERTASGHCPHCGGDL